MAKRPVFIPQLTGESLVREEEIEFVFFNGFAVSQKQKSINSLHEAAVTALELSGEILEVSTKSMQKVGTELSAFNLTIASENYGEILLEAAFQGSKVFHETGQDPYLYDLQSGTEIKKRVGAKSDQTLTQFVFDGQIWELEPKTAFYDWLYLQALFQRDHEGDITNSLKGYAAFTDIEFNPKRSINCQARSCAMFLALRHRNLLDDALSDKSSFLQVLADFNINKPPEQTALTLGFAE